MRYPPTENTDDKIQEVRTSRGWLDAARRSPPPAATHRRCRPLASSPLQLLTVERNRKF